MIWKLILTAGTVALAFVGTWAADRYGVKEPYNGLVVEFLGAAVVAVLTWALVSVPKRKQLFLELKRNHIQLLGVWKLGPRLNDSELFLLRHTVSLQRGVFPHLDGLGLADIIKEYDERLGELVRTQEEKVRAGDSGFINWSPTYTKPWNDCHAAFAKLARRISFIGNLRIRKEKFQYELNGAEDRTKRSPSPKFDAASHPRA